MKKVLAILAIALFLGGISVPVIAANNNALTLISLQDDDPKKKADGEKTATEADAPKEATTSGGDCSNVEKAETPNVKQVESTETKKAETAKTAATGSCG